MATESVLWVRPGSPARPSGLGSVQLAGHIRDSAGVPAPPQRDLGAYAVVYLLAGGGYFADDRGLSVRVEPGDLLLLFPGVAHAYGPAAGDTWSEIYLVFDGPVFDLWLRSGVIDPARPVWHLEPIDEWAQAFDRVLAPVGAGTDMDAGAALTQVCRLQAVLAEALAAAQPSDRQAGEDRQWLARATALLAADTRREADLADVAAALGFSYDGFRKRFRRLAGVSPARYRAVRSIDRARELIATTGWSDRQIAAELGFCDEFHFSHRFKQLTGQTPRRFRASLPRRRGPGGRPVRGRRGEPDGRAGRAGQVV